MADGIILVVITAALRNLNGVISSPIITLPFTQIFDPNVIRKN
jgi:hypothetical protein